MWLLSAVSGALAITLTIGIGISSHATGSEKADSLVFVAIRLLLPVAILLAYAWRGYEYANRTGGLRTLRRARLGQLGDSLYFLGFLWTLWALIDSFVIHQMSIAEAVFRAFGYALVTTAFGMFLRLLLLQFSYSDEEQVRLGEQTVEEEIATFTVKVREAVDSLTAFRTQTDNAVRSWIQTLNGSAEDLKLAVAGVTEQTTDLKEALLKMHETSADHVDKLVEGALDEFIKRLEPSLQALNTANSEFVTEVTNNTAFLTDHFKQSTGRIEQAVSQGVKNVENAAATGAEQVESELVAASGAIKASLEKSSRTIETASNTFAVSLSTQMTSLESSLRQLSVRINDVNVPVDIVEKSVADKLASLNSAISESSQAIKQQALEFASGVSTKTASIYSEIDRLVQTIKKIEVPDDIVEKQLREQLLPLSAAVRNSAETIENASTNFAGTLNSQRRIVESEVAALSNRIQTVRVPADMVEKAINQQLTALNATLAKSGRTIEAATTEFSKSLSKQLPALTSQLAQLSEQMRGLDIGRGKSRWSRFFGG